MGGGVRYISWEMDDMDACIDGWMDDDDNDDDDDDDDVYMGFKAG